MEFIRRLQSDLDYFLSFITKIKAVGIKVTIFPIIIGHCCNNNPYTTQKLTPIVAAIYIINEISSVRPVLIIFIACGTELNVVKVAAIAL